MDKQRAPCVEYADIEDTEGAARVLERLAFGRLRVDGQVTAVPHFGARVLSDLRSYSPDGLRPTPISGGRAISPTKSAEGDAATRRTFIGLGPAASEAERSRRTDELLDLLGPTDVVNVFFRQTDLVLRLLVRMLPTRVHGEALVKAVSWNNFNTTDVLTGRSSSKKSIGCTDVSDRSKNST